MPQNQRQKIRVFLRFHIVCNIFSLPYKSEETRNIMLLWQNLLEDVKLNFLEYITQGHAFIIDHFLQSFFLMMAITKIITLSLEKVNSFFAKQVNEFLKSSNLIKLLFSLFFFYLKIWSAYSAYLEILGYFCSVSLCIYLYKGCVRMGMEFSKSCSKNIFGNISSIFSITLIFLSYKVFCLSKVQDQQIIYPFVGFYFLFFGFILIISLLRKKQSIYILIIMTMMASIIMLREWSNRMLKETFLCKVSLPLQCLVYLLFAVHQNYKEKQEERRNLRGNGEDNQEFQKVKPCDIFLAQVYYFVFFLINQRMFRIQIIFATVCAVNYLGRKSFG